MRKLFICMVLSGLCLLGLSLRAPKATNSPQVAAQPIPNAAQPIPNKVVVDLEIIAKIESNHRANAYNSASGATGMFQVTAIALKDYNQQTGKQYKLRDMYDPAKARMVADWTLHVRFPQFFRAMNLDDTLENRIIAWNAGISYVKHKKPLPTETRNFITKYQRLKAAKKPD